MADFDIIAVGENLGTLLAAGLGARRGRRVLLVSAGANRRLLREGPHVVDPRLQTQCGLQRAIARRVTEELGLTRFIAERVRPHQPAFQVLLPRARVDVTDDDEALIEALTRELGVRRLEVERLLFGMAQSSLRMERLLQGESFHLATTSPEAGTLPFRHVPSGSALGAVLRAPSATCGALAPGQAGPLPAARVFCNWRQQTCVLDGELAAFELELFGVIQQAGGVVLPDTVPLDFLPRDGRPRGVTLEGRPHPVHAEQFILGLGPEDLARYGLAPVWSPEIQVAGRRHVLQLWFRRGWVPPSLGRHFVIPSAGEPTTVLRGEVRDPTATSDEVLVTVQLATVLDPTETDRALEARACAALREVVPFFDEAFLRVSAPPGPPEPLYAVSRGPAELDPLRGVPAGPLSLGPDVVWVHPLVMGVLGTEGEFATAWAALELLCGASQHEQWL